MEARRGPLQNHHRQHQPQQPRSLNDRYFTDNSTTPNGDRHHSVPNGGDPPQPATRRPLPPSTPTQQKLRGGVHRRLCTSVVTYVDECHAVWTASTPADVRQETDATVSHKRTAVVVDGSGGSFAGVNIATTMPFGCPPIRHRRSVVSTTATPCVPS
jgi:hypothetical protein